MAVLTDAARAVVWADTMRQLSNDHEAVGITKADLRAAVDALDSFLDSNAAAINSAIPQPARGSLSTSQKARLLMYVIERRYVDGA